MIEPDRTFEAGTATEDGSSAVGAEPPEIDLDLPERRTAGIFDVEDTALLSGEEAEDRPVDRRRRAHRILFVILWAVPVVGFLFIEVTARAVRYNLAADPGRQQPLPRPYDEVPVRIWQAFIDGLYPLGGRTAALVLVGVGVVGFLVGALVLTWLAILPSEDEWTDSLSRHPPEPHPRP